MMSHHKGAFYTVLCAENVIFFSKKVFTRERKRHTAPATQSSWPCVVRGRGGREGEGGDPCHGQGEGRERTPVLGAGEEGERG